MLFLLPAKRDHRKRYGDRHIDASLSSLNVVLEIIGLSPLLRGIRHTIAMTILFAEADSILYCVNFGTREDGPQVSSVWRRVFGFRR